MNSHDEHQNRFDNRALTRAAAACAAGAGVLLLRRAIRERYAIDFTGRVVLISGGSRGLGLEMARCFAAEGARIALLARDADGLRRAQDELAGLGARVFIVSADVRDREDVNRAVLKVVTHYGRLDVLVNNAGVISVGPIEHMGLEDYEHAMAVHYWGPLYTTLAAVPHLRRVEGARVVNITSIGGKIAVPHLTPYTGSKFALVGLSDAMRAELAPHGIRVTTVCPGLMRTGSPINATFKGRHADEFTWFTIGGSLPVLSVSARRAAAAVVEACRIGAPSLVIGMQARLAIVLQSLAPGLVATGMAVAARLLPSPNPEGGEQSRLGRDTPSRWAPSVLTRLGDEAAERNNEIGRALPIEAGATDDQPRIPLGSWAPSHEA
jgi:NAD(P)-dependent dehydrogenase (short-subunit alcohol dehydrogenase family)